MSKKQISKITLYVPVDLLKNAQEASGGGITFTVIQALRLLAASRTYDRLRKLRGKIKLDINLKTLREDRI